MEKETIFINRLPSFNSDLKSQVESAKNPVNLIISIV